MKSLVIFSITICLATLTWAQGDLVQAKVDGMGCPFCANGLERAFRDLKGIKQFRIDLQQGEMRFLSPAEASITAEEIVRRVDNAGYTATSVTIRRQSGEEIAWKPKGKTAAAHYQEEVFRVYGNCGMCKSRIEKAVNELPGIFSAFWNDETKMLHVRFDGDKVSREGIEKKVVAVGHDTDRFKADQDVYDNLHACCQYERKD